MEKYQEVRLLTDNTTVTVGKHANGFISLSVNNLKKDRYPGFSMAFHQDTIFLLKELLDVAIPMFIDKAINLDVSLQANNEDTLIAAQIVHAKIKMDKELVEQENIDLIDSEAFKNKFKAFRQKAYAVFLVDEDCMGNFAAVTRPEDPTLLGLPGGKVEEEENEIEALFRECQEEGWMIDTQKPVKMVRKELVDGKLCVWYKGSSVRMDSFKEEERIKNLRVSKEELLKSPYNSFLAEFNPLTFYKLK